MYIFPVDTGRKLNAHETLRRRTGRLLKVLWTSSERLMYVQFTSCVCGDVYIIHIMHIK